VGLSDTFLKETHPRTIPALKPQNQITSNLAGMVLGWVSFKNVSDSPALHKGAIQESFQQSLVEIASVVSEEKIFFKFHPPFFLICIIGQNRQKGFSVKFFFQPIYTDYANWAYFDKNPI
jgi:hypothetical protein